MIDNLVIMMIGIMGFVVGVAVTMVAVARKTVSYTPDWMMLQSRDELWAVKNFLTEIRKE